MYHARAGLIGYMCVEQPRVSVDVLWSQSEQVFSQVLFSQQLYHQQHLMTEIGHHTQPL